MINRGRVFRGVAALSAGVLTVVLCAATWAQAPPQHLPGATTGEKISAQVFKAPQLKKRTLDVLEFLREYPPPNEGWVTLSMMVDVRGKPFEVAVIDSSGDKALNEAVADALQGASFVPGSLNGKPVESSYELRYRTVTEGVAPNVSLVFVGALKSLTAAIQAKDRPAADAAMKKVKIEDATEYAYLQLATYQYAQVWGDEAQQLTALRRSLTWQSRTGDALPKEVSAVALRACLRLELKMQEYAEAIATWKRLQDVGVDPDTARMVAPMIQELNQLRLDHREVEVSGQLGRAGWFLQLFKPQFRIEVTDGRISDVKLRCQGRYLSFTFDPKLQYQVTGNSGNCTIQLDGAEGTRFKFVEF